MIIFPKNLMLSLLIMVVASSFLDAFRFPWLMPTRLHSVGSIQIRSHGIITQIDGSRKESAAESILAGGVASSGDNKKTFKRFMQIELWRGPPEMESLYPILCSVEQACRDINRLMRRVSTDNLDGFHTISSAVKGTNNGTAAVNSMNIQGEDQKKLDVIANRIMKVALCCSGKVSIVASEEDDKACLCSAVVDNAAFSGDYAAVFDPLDGSSNVDTGLPTGTIFGVYRNPKYVVSADPSQTVKQRGSELVAAGYCLYSASTHLVITLRSGLHMFTLDDISGEFFLTKSNVRIPRQGPIYSFNHANLDSWSKAVRYFIEDFRQQRVPGLNNDPKMKPSARYMGALVADVHNLLVYGGIFGYPGTESKPKGKIRLLYEANPLALVLEEAGGAASNGVSRILDVSLTDIHQRSPLFIGSADTVAALERYVRFYSKDVSSSSDFRIDQKNSVGNNSETDNK